MGGSFPPHWKHAPDGTLLTTADGRVVHDTTLDEASWYWGDGFHEDTRPGLAVFLRHSDCDGEIGPEDAMRVANDLEALLPAVAALGSLASGHLARDGGYVAVLQRFIAGCRKASAAGEPLTFR